MRIVPSLVAAAAVLFAQVALAQDQEAPEPLSGERGVSDNPETVETEGRSTAAVAPAASDEDEPEAPLVPPAADTLGGHVALSPSAALAWPAGSLRDGLDQSSVAAGGWALGLDAGVGVSRSVVIGAWGQMTRFGAPDDCSSCDLSSFGFGGFIRYHLVQGVRFDPWIAAGLGYRIATLDGSPEDGSYSGLEWLRLQLGGDWYAFDVLGIGPLLELDLGSYTSHPGDAASSVHTSLLLGVRATLDLPGK